ncbi:MAG: hypothetical protein CMM87_03735 [Rickettsiales bacterium]|nr:hypothetical protein [Rickettsiales bacterium]|tara:strand:+ start:2916 stop:3266 length:351 start_codon:yes stop_codon:yes gene_type:complete
MAYIYQNKILIKVSLICALFCTTCYALPGLDDETVSKADHTQASNLSPAGCGALPTDSEPLEMISFNENDTNAPVDMRKGYVRKYDPKQHMYYYEKEHASGLIQFLKELLWNLWFY